jgi:putative transposase
VWVTKYRKKAIVGDIGYRAREILREVCREEEVEIIKGFVSADHVHMMVSIPPQVTVSRLVQRLKGKSSYKLLHEFESRRREYWGRHLWARGYFCCSSGNVTDEVIKAYIEQQEQGDGSFKVSGDE